MANIKSSKKRVRNSEVKRARNRYQHKSTRTVMKALRLATSKEEAEALLPKASSMLDKLAKTNILHKNKVANMKSSLAKHVATLK